MLLYIFALWLEHIQPNKQTRYKEYNMHSPDERFSVLRTILDTARHIALHNPMCPAGQAAWEYLRFCIRNGCCGGPTESAGQFTIGSYLQLGKPDAPSTTEEAKKVMGIIVCFSDEVLPCNPIRIETSDGLVIKADAYISQADQILVIGDADLHTPMELGITLLHEVRHARHYFGDRFEKLPPLDPEEFHESRTWKYELDLLDACGGNAWQQTVEKEMNLIAKQYATRGRSPGEKYFAMSGQSYPELDHVFGTSISPPDCGKRYVLVSMRANFLLAEKANIHDLDTAYANIIGEYYDWSKKQVNKT